MVLTRPAGCTTPAGEPSAPAPVRDAAPADAVPEDVVVDVGAAGSAPPPVEVVPVGAGANGRTERSGDREPAAQA